MQNIEVSRESFATGDQDFYFFVRDMLTGADETPSVDGYEAIPGVTLACVDFGIRRVGDVVAAVSLVTGCEMSTVRRFVGAYTGSDPKLHLFVEESGHLIRHRGAVEAEYPPFATAA